MTLFYKNKCVSVCKTFFLFVTCTGTLVTTFWQSSTQRLWKDLGINLKFCKQFNITIRSRDTCMIENINNYQICKLSYYISSFCIRSHTRYQRIIILTIFYLYSAISIAIQWRLTSCLKLHIYIKTLYYSTFCLIRKLHGMSSATAFKIFHAKQKLCKKEQKKLTTIAGAPCWTWGDYDEFGTLIIT